MLNGRTALHVAAAKNKPSEVVALLLKHKAAIDLGDERDGRTALHMAAMKNKRSETVELLLEHKASIDLQDTVRAWAYGGARSLHGGL